MKYSNDKIINDILEKSFRANRRMLRIEMSVLAICGLGFLTLFAVAVGTF